jgi:nucleotide-binding universal stress UspA family protein
MQQLIVPIDGSTSSWSAAAVAITLARRADAPIDVVEVVADEDAAADALDQIAAGIGRLDASDLDITSHALLVDESVAVTLGDLIEQRPGATIVMSSHGRGRTAALVGSVVEELIQREFGPIVVVGPEVRRTDLEGRVLITVDGSETSEAAVPLGVAWGIELEMIPWILEVVDPDLVVPPDTVETAYTSRLARSAQSTSGHRVEFEVAHGRHAAPAIVEYAERTQAGLIVCATHGRTGMPRFALGSTAASIVHGAPCPVLLHRPPHFAIDSTDRRTAASR